MQMLAESTIYVFNEFRLDTTTHRLTRADTNEIVSLTPKVAEVLIYMVENAGRVLSKEELLEAVWDNTIVEESNLSQSIFILRKMLGEDTKAPRFILTLPNRGYQFIAPIREEAGSGGSGHDAGQNRFVRRGTANPEAYQSYVRGRFFWNKRTGVSLKKAVEHFEKAIEQDPNFANAYKGLAHSHQLLSEFYAAATPNESPAKTESVLDNGIVVDARLAEAHAGLAYAEAFYDWDWEGAERSFKRALELDPDYATAHQWYADYLAVMGRFDESREHIERAIEVDPLSPMMASPLAGYYYTQRRYDELIRQAERVIELDPNFAYGYFYLGFGYEGKGRDAEAVAAIAKAAVLFGEPADCADELIAAFENGGVTGLWQKRLEQYETRPHLKHHPTYLRALIPIRLGDKEATLDLLEQAFEQRDRGIIYAKYEPLLESVRDEPRFQELIRRIGL